MHTAENLAARACLVSVAHRHVEIDNKSAQIGIGFSGLGLEGGKSRGTIANDTVPPFFRSGEYALAAQLVGTQCRKTAANRLRIQVAHQFADQLLLSPERPARLHRSRIAYRVAESIVEPHRREFGVAEVDELFA